MGKQDSAALFHGYAESCRSTGIVHLADMDMFVATATALRLCKRMKSARYFLLVEVAP